MTMAADVEDLLREVAAKHGVAIGRDDPIMVLHTINERLLKDSAAAQQEALNALQSELESIAARWGNDAKDKAERILNAALKASREAMQEAADQAAKQTAQAVRAEVDRALAKAKKDSTAGRVAAIVNIAASCLTLGAVLLLLLAARH